MDIKSILYKYHILHSYVPFLRKNGKISRQYEVCSKCGKKRNKCNFHEWNETFTFFGFKLQLEEDGLVTLSSSPKEIRECKKCGLFEIVYSHQR